MLHAFDGVLGVRGGRQVEANGTWHEGNLLQNGPRRHAPNWETNRGQVEIAAHNGATDLSNYTFNGTSQVVLGLHIIKRKTAILMSIRAPPFVIDLQRLEVLSSFKELLDIEAELLGLWLMGRVLICSEHLLDNLLLLILRQIILERKVLARLQVVHGVEQA